MAGGQLSDFVINVVENMKDKDTGDIPGISCFFPGCHYIFPDTNADNIHNRQVKNQTAQGRKIVLDPREPPDDLSKPYRMLSYPPLAIFVQPDGPPIGDVCGGLGGCPINCIPMTHSFHTFTVSWIGAQQLFKDGYEVGCSMSIKRFGIQLSLAYAVTGKMIIRFDFLVPLLSV